MIAVDTDAETIVNIPTSNVATAADVEGVVVEFVEMVGNVEELELLVEIEALTMADMRLNGIATTKMAFAIVMKLRPYTLKDASRISPTERGRNIGTPPGKAPIASPYRPATTSP